MDDRVARLRIGPYVFMRQIEPGRFGDRWMAVHDEDDNPFIVHRFQVHRSRAEQKRFAAAVETLATLDHPHLLPVVEFSLGSAAGNAWVVTPFTGNQEGLLTLDRLVRDKGGRLSPKEAERALVQLLEAADYAHSRGPIHGPIRMDQVLVDRHGSLLVEMYGFDRAIGTEHTADAARDEVRSLVEMGYRMVTGLTADDPRIPAGRLVPRLPRRLDRWFEAGLDPVEGFTTAQAALDALTEEAITELRVNPVRTMIGRIGKALGAS